MGERRTPRVSIIIPISSPETLTDLLAALANQSVSNSEYEAILVCSRQVDMQAAQTRDQTSTLQVRWLTSRSKNRAEARNLGLSESGAEVVVSLDEDILPQPKWLEEHLQWHRPDTHNVVLGKIVTDPESPELFVAAAMNWTPEFEERFSIPGYKPSHLDFQNANFSVRRQHLVEAGGWSPAFGNACGYDTDLGTRLVEYGLTLQAGPDAIGLHRYSTPMAEALLGARATGRAQVALFSMRPDRVQDLLLVPYVVGPAWNRALSSIAHWTPRWISNAITGLFSRIDTRGWELSRWKVAFARRLASFYLCAGFWEMSHEFRRASDLIRSQSQTVHWFQNYWLGKTSPEHRSETDTFLAAHAKELSTLSGEASDGNVLEIGCGSGTLFGHMGFNPSKYRGVDFSRSMLSAFAARNPGLDLVCAEGSSYADDRKYDLIFSNYVLQHFDAPMIETHLTNVRRMLGPGGRVVWGTIPDSRRRWRYLGGMYQGSAFWNPLIFLTKVLEQRFGKRSGFGHWHRPEDLQKLAAKHGFALRYVTSETYPYRFHAVLTRDENVSDVTSIPRS